MPVEKSAGAVIFRKEKKSDGKEPENFYLVLHYSSTKKEGKSYWDFSKGHIEEGEGEAETIKREVEEETGIKNINFIEGFRELIKYFFKFADKTIFKTVVFYLGETEEEKVKISEEHIGYKWLPFDQAREQLTFANAKEVLQRANNFLLKETKNRQNLFL